MLGRVKLWAMAGLAFALALLGIRGQWLAAQRDKAEARAREAEAYRNTRKAIDDATDDLGDDPDLARRWLRERAQR